MIQHVGGETGGLGGGEDQHFAGVLQITEHLLHAGIDRALEFADGGISLAVEGGGFAGVLVAQREHIAEGVVEGRADEGQQFFPVGLFDAHFPQGVLNAVQNALLGVGDGAVQIEKNGFLLGKVHVLPPCRYAKRGRRSVLLNDLIS